MKHIYDYRLLEKDIRLKVDNTNNEYTFSYDGKEHLLRDFVKFNRGPWVTLQGIGDNGKVDIDFVNRNDINLGITISYTKQTINLYSLGSALI